MSTSDFIRDTVEAYAAKPFLEMKSAARTDLGVTFARDDDKEACLEKIRRALGAPKNFLSEEDTSAPAPGWARIKIHSTDGLDSPIYFDHNGYYGWLPVNTVVDVPIKITRADGVLRSAKHVKIIKRPVNAPIDVTSTDVGDKWIKEDAVPFSILHFTPGPDPRPGREVILSAKRRDKMTFRDQYKYWPSDEEVAIWTKTRIQKDLNDNPDKL